MWSHVVMVDLIARNDRGIFFLQASHDLFSISDLSVESFHFPVVVCLASPCGVFNMLGLRSSECV